MKPHRMMIAFAAGMMLCSAAYAGPFRFSWNAADIGFTVNMPSPAFEPDGFDLTVGLADVVLEHTFTRIAVDMEALKLSLLFSSDPAAARGVIHFVNPTLSWDALSDTKMFAGPVTAFNFISLKGFDPFFFIPNSKFEPEWNFTDMDFRAGVRFLYSPRFEKSYFLPFAAGSEFGFRYKTEGESARGDLYLNFALRLVFD